VADGALGHVQRSRELGRARCALAEQADDPAACEVTERAELFRILYDEDVVELVVGELVDDRGTYGKSRLFVKRSDKRKAGLL
jgi:hypothetical protein